MFTNAELMNIKMTKKKRKNSTRKENEKKIMLYLFKQKTSQTDKGNIYEYQKD